MFLFTFFTLPLIFSLVAASISHFLTTATNSCCSSNKKWLLISWSRSPSLFFSLSFAAACRLFSLFLCRSLSLYSKFVDMTINLSLILQTTRTQKQFLPSVLLLTLQLSPLQKTRVAMGFPAKISSSYIWFVIPFDRVILHWYACGGANGRMYGHVITKIRRMVRLPHFLRNGATLARAWSSAITYLISLSTYIIENQQKYDQVAQAFAQETKTSLGELVTLRK